MRLIKTQHILLLLALIVIACQEDTFQEKEAFDQDMITASALAKDYLNTQRGRLEDKDDYSITVLKFKDGLLLFDTNTDEYEDYQEVREESVTAIAKPGERIFWFAGEGIARVEGIEFTKASEDVLEELPDDFIVNEMWVVQIPTTSKAGTVLKYDIVYTTQGGGKIRLDPKIQIQN